MHLHPDRLLPLEGTTNFRDLGGYVGQDGRPLRWRRLFRSEHLAGLTEADQAALAALGLSRSFDFRGDDERAATPYRVPGVAHHPLAIEPTVVQRLQAMADAGQPINAPAVTRLMTELYRDLVNQQAHRYAELFAQLLQAEAPLVFHCTAGKDRTGVAAALILLALGVPRDQVMADYLLTNLHFKHPASSRSASTAELPDEARAVLWGVQPVFLDAALDAIDSDQGGIDAYLARRLAVGPAERAALASRYLQP